jgi:hypothetical protein
LAAEVEADSPARSGDAVAADEKPAMRMGSAGFTVVAIAALLVAVSLVTVVLGSTSIYVLFAAH